MAGTEFRETLGTLGIPRAGVAALFAVAPRAERRWRDGSRPIPHGVRIVLRLLATGRVTVAEVEQAAAASLPGNRRIGEELRKVPKAARGAPVAKTPTEGKLRKPGLAATGIKHSQRSRLGKLADISDAEVEEAAAATRMNGSALPVAPMPAAAPASTAQKVAALASDACRWPCGDPRHADFCFCGNPVARRPYCESHSRMAYVPPSARRHAMRPGLATAP